jgi:uncharacterized protein (DUF1501 family)
MSRPHDPERRALLRAGLYGAGLGLGVPTLFRDVAWASPAGRERILVVVELSGGCDGLNTVAPIGDDAYAKARPKIALDPAETLRLDDHFALHPRLFGLHNLWKQDRVAIVHGCGYPDPDRSHFTSMRYWHTAAPHRAEARGWVGRYADARWPEGRTSSLVNLAEQESQAIRSFEQAPIVFSDPAKYLRRGEAESRDLYARLSESGASRRDMLGFVRNIAATARETSQSVRKATSSYETPVHYGAAFAPLARGLQNVAALLEADFPAQVYYLPTPGWDTHSAQSDRHNNLHLYLGDTLEAFQKDLDRQGRAADVMTLVFTEFGRRVHENESGGTDHGTATPMLWIGERAKAGLHGKAPSLTELDEQDDLIFTTDFRRVYASVLEEWLGLAESSPILGARFEPLGLTG